LGEMIRIAAPVATTRAIAKGLARAVLATREVTTKEVTTREVTTMEATTKEDTTRVATTRAAQTREADANATTAKRSLTRTEGHMEPAEGWQLVSCKKWRTNLNTAKKNSGRITLDATGATQLGGETLDVATCSLLKGFQTTPGPTELVHTTGSSSNALQCLVFHVYFDLRFASDYIDSMNITGFL